MWSLVAALQKGGLSKDDCESLVLRPLVRQISGQEHTSKLTEGQAERVIQALQDRVNECQAQAEVNRPEPAPHPPWAPRSGPRKEATITPFQQVILKGMYGQLGWGAEQQRGFSQRQCKKPWPQTQKDADAILEALSAMVMRAIPEDGIVDRVAKIQAASGRLDQWKKNFLADLLNQVRAGGKDALSPFKLQKLIECEEALKALESGE